MKLLQFSNSLGLIFANSKISSNLENPPEYSDFELNKVAMCFVLCCQGVSTKGLCLHLQVAID